MSSSHQQKVVLIASIVKSVLWRSIDKYTEGYIEKKLGCYTLLEGGDKGLKFSPFH